MLDELAPVLGGRPHRRKTREYMTAERLAPEFAPAPAVPGTDNGRPPRTASTSHPLPALHVRRGPRVGSWFGLTPNGVSVLGRRADCDIVLPSVTVSRRHAEIRPEPGRFLLVDLGSLSGSYVNGHAVESAVLTDGDDVAIGMCRLTFHAASPRPAR
jgi:pSer/pThr/pTyr-binding forkhead associated (FHA) protein